MNLKPARERICEASTGELSFILFLCALFAVTALLPFPSHAQSTESQPQRAVAGPSKAQPQPQPDSERRIQPRGKMGHTGGGCPPDCSRILRRFSIPRRGPRKIKTPDEKGYKGLFTGSDKQCEAQRPGYQPWRSALKGRSNSRPKLFHSFHQ